MPTASVDGLIAWIGIDNQQKRIERVSLNFTSQSEFCGSCFAGPPPLRSVNDSHSDLASMRTTSLVSVPRTAASRRKAFAKFVLFSVI